MIVCPVCATENEKDVINCVVCGERLAPLAPGEEVDPSEMVAAQLMVQGVTTELGGGELAAAEAPQGGFAMDEEFDAPEAEPAEAGPAEEPVVTGGFVMDEEFDTPVAAQPVVVEEPVVTGGFVMDEEFDAPAGSEEPALGDDLSVEPAEAEPPAGGFVMDEEFDAPVAAEPEAAEEPVATGGFVMDEEFDAPAVAEEPVVEAPVDHAAAAVVEPPRRDVVASPDLELRTTAERPALQPLPTPGTHSEPATLTLYVNREPVLEYRIDTDETLIGRKDPISDSFPDIDMGQWDSEGFVSRKHAYIYRQNKNYTLYVVSNAGTQLGNEIVGLSERRQLQHNDIIVLAGKFAMKFELPQA